MQVEVQSDYYSIEQCENNINKIYVFGDNLIQKGNAGQAIIRHCLNSHGIPTKRYPSRKESAYFSDKSEEYASLIKSVADLYNLSQIITNVTIVFPSNGLGTGLSDMPNKSPRLFFLMSHLLDVMFGVKTVKSNNTYILLKKDNLKI